MPIYWVALLVCILMPAAGHDAVPTLERPWVWAVTCVAAWGLIAKWLAIVQARRVLKQRIEFSEASERLSRWLNHLRWLWLPIGALGLTACGWSQQVEIWIPKSSTCLTACLLMLPSLLAVAATWIAEVHFCDWADSESADSESANDETLRQAECHRLSVFDMIVQRFRLQAGWIVLPVLFVLASVDIANVLLEWLHVESTWMGGAIGLLMLPFLLPKLIATAWATSRCRDDRQTAWLCELVRIAGYRSLDVRRWETDHRICTAMIAGVFPGFRVLLLSDALLERLDRPAVAMVALHELAHVARRHIALRMVSLLPVWAIATFVSVSFAKTPTEHAACAGLGLLLTAITIRFIAHATEYDADQYACRIAPQVAAKLNREATPDRLKIGDVPATTAEAAKALAYGLILVSGNSDAARRAGWMHPSLIDRVRRLQQLANASEAVNAQPHLSLQLPKASG